MAPARPVVHVAVLAVLLVLTGTSWGLSRVLGPGWDLATALAIALVKGSLVAFVFMNLRGRPLRFAVALVLALGLGALLAGLGVGDVALRPGDTLWAETDPATPGDP